MASYNRITIMGNLVRDPEVRYVPSGAAVCTFSLAVNRKYKQGEEWKESVTYIDVEAWNRLAETAGEYLKKGKPTLVEGRLEQDRWEAQDGQKRSKHKVVALQIVFLGSRGEEGGTGTEAPDRPVEDDIPF